MDRKEWMRQEIAGWRDEGLVDGRTAETLIARYASTAGRISWGVMLAGGFGALMIGLGIIALFAANWDCFGRPARAAISLAPVVLCGLAALVASVKGWKASSFWEPLGILWAIATGAATCLVAQTYQVGGSVPGLILFVSLLALPVVWITRSVALIGALTGFADSAEMKLMSFNVLHCAGMDGKLDINRTAGRIRAENPDFACLQEIDWRTARVNGVDEPAELARLTGMHATFAKAIFYAGGQYGVMMLSRQKPLRVEQLPLPGKEPRVLLLCEFADCIVGTTHLSVATEAERVESVALIREALKDSPKPVFLTGDWNATPDSSTIA